ncbi:MAG: hypothetical protein BGN84_05800 [Afipia sp. 62-7]|nr:DUF1178 family protein [Afipia sp.]OJU21667.1 MAG: hypothetical protein BGN84_05800 [Afipia sp. 62-7]
MIRYALHCERGHEFDSWFQSSGAYDSQRKRGLIACPVCESTKVDKAIMAPRITRKGKSSPAPQPAAVSEAASPPSSLVMAPQERELVSKLRELRDHVLKNADNVGNKFPEEARKMHYGDIEHRAIYGEATAEEARSLIDEGVEVAPLPVLPDDRN